MPAGTVIEEGRLQFIGGTSRKFWEWSLTEHEGMREMRQYGKIPSNSPRRRWWTLAVRWGRIGTKGQQPTEETFDDKNLAQWKAALRVRGKLAEGYKVVKDTRTLGATTFVEDYRKPKPARAPAQPKPPAPAPDVLILGAVRRIRLRD